VDLVILVSGTMMRHAEASDGRLIPKAVFFEKRLSFAPNVPTVKEVGLDVPKEIMPLLSFDIVYAAPYGLPADVHKVLNEAIEKTLRDVSFAELMEKAKLPVSELSSNEMQNRAIELYKVMPKYIESIRRGIGS